MRERPMFALAWVCVLSVLFQFYRKPILLICAVLLILYVMDWKRKDKKKSIAGGIVLLAMFFLFFITLRSLPPVESCAGRKLKMSRFLQFWER